MKQRLGILYCESLSDEINTALGEKSLPDLVIRSYPRHSIQSGDNKNPIEDPMYLLARECGRIIIIGCGCMSPIQIPGFESDPPEILILDIFSDILLTKSQVTSYQREGSYMILPANLFRSEEYFRDQGFNPDEARMFFSDSIRKILCIDMMERQDAKDIIPDQCTTCNIPIERIPVGIKPLQLYISFQYDLWQHHKSNGSLKNTLSETQRKTADYAMMVDLLGEITTLQNEEEVIEHIIDLFTLLFSPHAIVFLQKTAQGQDILISRPPGFFDADKFTKEYGALPEESGVTNSNAGFYISLNHDQTMLGTIVLEDVAMPERVPDYLDISQFIIKVCSLALVNARQFDQIEKTMNELEDEIQHRKQIENALHLASKKLNLLSSVTRHDILNSLNALLAFLDYSRTKVKDNKAVSDYVESEIRIAETIQHQIEFTRYYESIGINAPGWQDIEKIIIRASQSVNLTNTRLTINLKNLEVFCDELIEKVFINLLDNTLRHSEHASIISISCHLVNHDMMLIYSDDGVGVTFEEKERVFERGFGKHTGFGMFLTREMLSITDISIHENGEPGKGVRFEMIIPEGKFRGGTE